jgi:sec-independent protein translocase protein TatA
MPLVTGWMPSGWEWLIILAIGLLLFGRRLPEVGRSLGRAIVEFKKGVKGVEDEIEGAAGSSEPGASQRALNANGGDERRVSTSEKVEERA